MTMVPAMCGNCGNVFPSGIELQNVREAILKNNKSQCPKCQQMARVPDGVYQAIGNTLKVLHDTDGSQELIDRLLQALGEIADKPNRDVRETLDNAGVPNAVEIANSAPEDQKQKAVWAAALGAALVYFTQTLPDGALSWIELIEKLQTLFGSP